MKMKSIIYTFVIVLIFLLFSCPSGNASIKATFISYNNNDGRYSTKNEVVVKPGVKFGDIKRTEEEPFEKDEFTYSFLHWSESIPNEGSIETEAPAFNDENVIRKNKTFYAVYSKVKTVKYTVTFKTFSSSSQGYKTIKTVSDISKDAPFKQIETPNVSIINNYLGYKYTFKYWTKNTPSGSTVKTSGVKFTEDDIIDDDITLYAVYESKKIEYTVKFITFDKQTDSYNDNPAFKSFNVQPNTILSSVIAQLTEDPQNVETNFVYSFIHWTDNTPNPSSEIDTTSDPVDATNLITKNTTLYAVYNEGNAKNYTVTLKSFNCDDEKYTVYKTFTNQSYNTVLNQINDYQRASEINDFKGKKYTFNGWSTTEITDENNPKTGNGDFAENKKIKEDITLYAVYTSAEVKYTVKLMSFNGNVEEPGYTEKKLDNVLYGTRLNTIAPYRKAPDIENYQESRYTFKGWTTTEVADETNPKTGDVDFEESGEVTKNLTLYAVYEVGAKHTITFHMYTFENYQGNYNTTETRQITDRYKFNMLLDRPTVVDVFKWSDKYIFDHWTTKVGSNDILTQGAPFSENTEITSDITLYAVYKQLQSLEFYVFVDDGQYRYHTILETKYVNDDDEYTFGDVKITEVPDVITREGNTYKFAYWTNDQDCEITSINKVDERSIFPDNTPITQQRYRITAVYRQMRTITFKLFSSFGQGGYDISRERDIEDSKPFSTLTNRPRDEAPPCLAGQFYEFVHWTEVEEVPSNTILTEGEQFPEESIISSNKTLYAVYKEIPNPFI